MSLFLSAHRLFFSSWLDPILKVGEAETMRLESDHGTN
jgi:hypothetical protein